MLLPCAATAVVTREKIAGHLLNPTHPDGAAKSTFFLSLGFRADDWQALKDVFLDLASTTPVAQEIVSKHGTKYIIDGRINSPVGRSVRVRTVWISDRGQTVPRLVTAYPLTAEDDEDERA